MTSMTSICNLENPEHPFVDGAPRACDRCAQPLCLRQQVLNLALGMTEQMKCLRCLSIENERQAPELLSDLRDYIYGRECFAKQWKRYSSLEYCPDQSGCEPKTCFANE